MRMPCASAALALMVGSAIMVPAQGQGSPAATGVLMGPDSKPKAGVPLLVLGPQGKTTVFTDRNGKWSLYNLAPGTYQVQPPAGMTTDRPTFTVNPR
jgi:hypothetical protein